MLWCRRCLRRLALLDRAAAALAAMAAPTPTGFGKLPGGATIRIQWSARSERGCTGSRPSSGGLWRLWLVVRRDKVVAMAATAAMGVVLKNLPMLALLTQ